MKIDVLNTTGKSTSLDISDVVFGSEVNKKLVAQAVRVYLSNQRQGTSKVKTRAEVDRTKKKWFKQKGTGNARHGARSANIFVGGGIAHGPNGEQNWSLKLSRQQKRKALMSALSAQKENISVTTVLSEVQPKTKDAVAFLKKLAPDSKRTLIVLHENMENIVRSTRNLEHVLITSAARLNIYETVVANKIIFTKEAIKILEDRLLEITDQAAKSVESPIEIKVKEVKVEKKVNKITKEKTVVVKKVSKKTKPTTKKS